MPDKREVDGSSPFGPTIILELRFQYIHSNKQIKIVH